jgi:hypothetical protein
LISCSSLANTQALTLLQRCGGTWPNPGIGREGRRLRRGGLFRARPHETGDRRRRVGTVGQCVPNRRAVYWEGVLSHRSPDAVRELVRRLRRLGHALDDAAMRSTVVAPFCVRTQPGRES